MSGGLVNCRGADGAGCPDAARILPGRRGCNSCTSPRRERPDRPRLTVAEEMAAAKRDAAEVATAEFERQRRWHR